jgi:uncharacterized protein (TIGR03435 family)
MKGGPGSSDPERIAWTGVTLQFLITSSFGMRGDQFSGPKWLGSEKYDLSAKIPPGATRMEFDEMLRNLLTSRFHLHVHEEPRKVSAFDLVVGRRSAKLKPSAPATNATVSEAESPAVQPLSEAQIRVSTTSSRDGTYIMTGTAASIPDLVRTLASRLGRRVIDKTALDGTFDFRIEFASSQSRGPSTNAPVSDGTANIPGDSKVDLIGALRQQLGLELRDTTVTVQVLVIDSVDKRPTEN